MYNLQLNPGITQVFISTCDGQLGEHRVALPEFQASDNDLQSSPAWVPTDLLLLWVKLHKPAGTLLVIQGFAIPVHSPPHSPVQAGEWVVGTSTLGCQAVVAGYHQANTEKFAHPVTHNSCSNTLNAKLQFKKSKISLALASPYSKHEALQWRPVLIPHGQLQAENAPVAPWHFFLSSFQSLFHWRKNMHGFKHLPLKPHTKCFGQHSSRSGKWPWSYTPAKETISRAVAITTSLLFPWGTWVLPWTHSQPHLPESCGSCQQQASETLCINCTHLGSKLPWAL